MTIERAVEIGASAAAAGATTASTLAEGTGMDQWLMWAATAAVSILASLITFRVTNEKRLTTVEQRVAGMASSVDIAELRGRITTLEVLLKRIDARMEQIAERVGAP